MRFLEVLRVELLMMVRNRLAITVGAIMPLLLLLFYMFLFHDRPKLLLGALGSLVTVVVIASAILSMPLPLILMRERDMLRRLRPAAAGPALLLLGRQVASGLFITAVLTILLLALAAFRAPLGAGEIVAILSLAIVQFLWTGAIGLAVASVAPSMSLGQVVCQLLLMFLMCFCGGALLVPTLPPTVQAVAASVPAYQLTIEMQQAVAPGAVPRLVPWAIVVTLLQTFLLLYAAQGVFRWDKIEKLRFRPGPAVAASIWCLMWIPLMIAAPGVQEQAIQLHSRL